MAVTLPLSIVIAIHEKYALAVLTLLSGSLKAVAYAIGWWIGYNTEVGEYLTGAFMWLSAYFIYLAVD